MPRPLWMEEEIVFSSIALREVDAHAVHEYPNESCGYLTGPSDEPATVDAAIRVKNLADDMHAKDPENFPRTAKMFYWIDPLPFDKEYNRRAKEGRPIKVVYHSHADAGAYFSAEDKANAAPFGEPSYEVAQLVTSVMQGKVADRKVFTFRDGEWVELPFRIE